LKYVEDKDVFQEIYTEFLGKRFIYDKSNIDAEKAMTNRLQHKCGYEFTTKLKLMFMDTALSSDLAKKFKLQIQETVQVEMYVMHSSAWHLNHSNPTEFTIPKELEKSVQCFEEFYRQEFKEKTDMAVQYE
jgi:cullin 2